MDNDKGPRRKVGKVLPKDARRRTFWKVRKEKRWLEMSQPGILMGESATVRFSNCPNLALAMQRYGLTMKQGEPTDGVKARYSYKRTAGTISPTARITKQIDDMREALRQARRR